MTGETTAEFDGRCAFALSVGPAEKAPQGKTEHALVKDGRTYVFAGAVPKWLFQVIPGSVERAQRRWASAAR